MDQLHAAVDQLANVPFDQIQDQLGGGTPTALLLVARQLCALYNGTLPQDQVNALPDHLISVASAIVDNYAG